MCREELINFDKYIFNKDGSIISKFWNKKLSGWIDDDGYLVSCLLLKNGNRQPYRVNRVIAYLFVPRPEHLKDMPYEELQVGHNDTDKKNNNVSNLYWCTSKENNNNPLTKEKQMGRKPWNKGLKGCYSEEALKKRSEKFSIPVKQLTKEGELIRDWQSVKKASEALGIKSSNITACLKNYPQHFTAGGFKWIYA